MRNAISALERTAGDENGVYAPAKLVNGPTLLVLLFDENSRPSLRWLRTMTKSKAIPFVRLGHLVFFYPPDVRAALEKRHTVNAKGVK